MAEYVDEGHRGQWCANAEHKTPIAEESEGINQWSGFVGWDARYELGLDTSKKPRLTESHNAFGTDVQVGDLRQQH